MCGDPFNICLLIWVAKLEMSHVLQSNKIKSYRGRSDRFSVSIGIKSKFLNTGFRKKEDKFKSA